MSYESGNHISNRNSQPMQLQIPHSSPHGIIQMAHTQPTPTTMMAASPTLSLIQQDDVNNLNHNLAFNNSLDQTLPANQQKNTKDIDLNLMVENVMPGIYLTKNFISWTKEQLAMHGFTHVIIIDKHIQELYYPNQQPEIFKLCSLSNNAANKRTSSANDGIHDDSSSINEFIDYQKKSSTGSSLNFDKEFEVIDLNFGEKSYLTTVLPNCYRAVKFINKALQSGGTILVIDCNGGEQKCLTIIVAYLMYKHNISFSNAFARLKEFYKKADLDRFYISQLYEYEPILQVQRAQSRGHSCSRELHAAILKRKKVHDDDQTFDNNNTTLSSSPYTNATTLFDNCNPLNRFDTTQMDINATSSTTSSTDSNKNGLITNFNVSHAEFMSGPRTGGWYNWEDYAME